MYTCIFCKCNIKLISILECEINMFKWKQPLVKLVPNGLLEFHIGNTYSWIDIINSKVFFLARSFH